MKTAREQDENEILRESIQERYGFVISSQPKEIANFKNLFRKQLTDQVWLNEIANCHMVHQSHPRKKEILSESTYRRIFYTYFGHHKIRVFLM